MRNDVKLGLAVGGVLLAVLIVYVLVVPGSEKPGDTGDHGGSQRGNHHSAGADQHGHEHAPKGAASAAPSMPIASNESGRRIGHDRARRSVGDERPRQAPKDPFDNQQVASADHDKGWDWNKLLNPTDTPELMNPTEVQGGLPSDPRAAESHETRIRAWQGSAPMRPAADP